MATRERPFDRGKQRGLDLVRRLGREVRLARRQFGLSMRVVASQVGISVSELSRIERGLAAWVSVVLLSEICAVVGLDLAARAYPGGQPVRDARHRHVLERLRALISSGLHWALEVPLPNRGDQRAWDAMIRGAGWRYGIECELNPIDGQALLRRLHLKERDGMVDGVILLMTDTRQTRAFRREFAAELARQFPVPARVALARLSQGLDPGGNALIVL